MNEGLDDKIGGKAKELAGDAEAGMGRATNDTEMEAKGEARQGEGKLDQAKGNVEDAFGDLKRNVKDALD